MVRLKWGEIGQRLFETGVDRGVLYLANIPGVAWNGLTAVNEAPTGGEARPFYIDGYKYANLSAAEEYAATIEALSCPPEFLPCDGSQAVSNGLFATQQPRVAFGFSYRTVIGSDTAGVKHGYKIHLVYNALAAPASHNHTSIADTVSPLSMSWSISTMSPLLTGMKPTAHLIIDSTKTNPDLLKDVEDILYGTETLLPRLPSPNEMRVLFESPALVGQWSGVAQRSTSRLINGRTGDILGINLAVNPGLEVPATLSISSEIARNFMVNPAPRRSGSVAGWDVQGATASLNTFSNFAPYSPDPTATGTILQAMASGTGRTMSVGLPAAKNIPAVAGRWYGALMWAAVDTLSPASAYQMAYQLTFANPAGSRYVNETVSVADAAFYSGERKILVGQAQAGDTTVNPNVYVRTVATNGVMASGKRLWADAWVFVEGPSEAAVRALLEYYWDGYTAPPGYETRYDGSTYDSPIILIPEGSVNTSTSRPREITRFNTAMGSMNSRVGTVSRQLNDVGNYSGVNIPDGGTVTTYVDLIRWARTPVDPINDSPGFETGHRYRFTATIELVKPQEALSGSLHAHARRLGVYANYAGNMLEYVTFDNVVGPQAKSVEFTVSDTVTGIMVRLVNGSDNPLDIIFFGDIVIEDVTSGSRSVYYWDGDTLIL